MKIDRFHDCFRRLRYYKAGWYSFAAGICYLLAGRPEAVMAAPLKDDNPRRLSTTNSKLEAEFNRRIAECNSSTFLDRVRKNRPVSNEKFSSLQLPVALVGTDNCPGTNIPAGTAFADSDTTVGANNTVTDITMACNGNYNEVAGPDKIYRFVLPAVGSRIATCSITVDPVGATGATGFDTSIYILGQAGGGCPSGPAASVTNCVEGKDSAFCQAPEVITDAEMDALPAGIYYLFVDSYYAAGGGGCGASRHQGAYTLNFVCTTLTPTASMVEVGGRVTTADGRGISKARVTITSATGEPRSALTNAFGFYSFDGIEAGQTYVVQVSAKGRTFSNPIQTVTVDDAVSNLNFVEDGAARGK